MPKNTEDGVSGKRENVCLTSSRSKVGEKRDDEDEQ